MNFRRLKTLILVFLQGCACEFSSLDRISQIKTPYEKMIAEQEYERQKNEAKPVLLAETIPVNITPSLPTETKVVEKVDQIDYSSFPVNGESDKSTAGDLQSIFFDFNWQTLNQNQKIILKQNAQELLRYPRVSIILSAHSDSLGNQSYNKNLSRNRALNVYKYLLKLGIPDNRMSIKVAGNAEPLTEVEFKPIKTKADLDFYKKALSQNRRVNFIVDSIEGINEVERNRIAAQNNQPREIIVSEEPKRTLASSDQPIEIDSNGFQTIYFPPSSARLSKEEIEKLAENIKLFKTKTNSTFIATIYVKGLNPEKVKQNMQLSAERAKVIYQQLLDQGINEADFSIKLAKIDDSSKSHLAAKEFRKVIFNVIGSKKEPVFANVPEKVVVPEKISPPAIVAKTEEIKNNQAAIFPIEKYNFNFESKQKYLVKADELKLVDLIKKLSQNAGANITFTLNTKGKTSSILSINQKLTDSRIKYIKSVLSLTNNKQFKFITLKPDLENTKGMINYRSLLVEVESAKEVDEPLTLQPIAKNIVEPKEKVVKPLLQQKLILNFASKKASLEEKSLQSLRELAYSIATSEAKLSLELFIKGSKPKDLAINSLLTERRKQELIKLFQIAKISKERLNFKIIKIDLEADRPKTINYRQLTISSDVIEKIERVEVAKSQKIELESHDLYLLEQELNKENISEAIADVIAKPEIEEPALIASNGPIADLTNNIELEFISKNKLLTAESMKKLEDILRNGQAKEAKLAFTLFVKGSTTSKLRINQKLAESRKQTIQSILKKYQVDNNQFEFSFVYPDKNGKEALFKGNYRLCLISQFKADNDPSEKLKIERKTSSITEEKKTFKKKSKLNKSKKKFKKLKKKKPLR